MQVSGSNLPLSTACKRYWSQRALLASCSRYISQVILCSLKNSRAVLWYKRDHKFKTTTIVRNMAFSLFEIHMSMHPCLASRRSAQSSCFEGFETKTDDVAFATKRRMSDGGDSSMQLQLGRRHSGEALGFRRAPRRHQEGRRPRIDVSRCAFIICVPNGRWKREGNGGRSIG